MYIISIHMINLKLSQICAFIFDVKHALVRLGSKIESLAVTPNGKMLSYVDMPL